jgi:hypothetical protein
MSAGLVESCVIRSNTTPAITVNGNGGGGVKLTGGTLRNCLVYGNVYTNSPTGNAKSYGGGVYLTGGRVENCTIPDTVLILR